MPHYALRHRRPFSTSRKAFLNRPNILTAVSIFLGTILIIKLFTLQIVMGSKFREMASEQHFGGIILPSRRGEILARDYHSKKTFKLATNTTLDLLYVDPLIAENKKETAEILAPLIFTAEDYKNCLVAPKLCPAGSKVEFKSDATTASETLEKKLPDNKEKEIPTHEEMIKTLEKEIVEKISKENVDFSIIKYGAPEDEIKTVQALNLPGIYINNYKKFIYGNPERIPQKKISEIAHILSPILKQSASSLKKKLKQRKVRYVPLKRKLSPETSEAIKKLKKKYSKAAKEKPGIKNLLKGVVLLPEHWRYYPDKNLSSQVIGFVNHDNIGQYGIEGKFDMELKGKKGRIFAESDPFGRQITVATSEIINAVDGENFVLTIDRVIQKKVETLLEESVQRFHALSGQIIVVDPFTGRITAMSSYPNFDPNNYGKVYTMRKLKKDEILPKKTKIFVKKEKEEGYSPAKIKDINNPETQKYVYENMVGEEAYKNKTISDIYEPGSVFKPIAMSIALDSHQVTSQTKMRDTGIVWADCTSFPERAKIKNPATNLFCHRIKNAEDKIFGWQNMTEVLEHSSNTGMAFVAKKLGKQLFYGYLKDFGFGKYSDIELDGEETGSVSFWKRWSETQLINTAFGQGIAATPLQVISAWSALANGGLLMQPFIVDSRITHKGKEIKTAPKIIRRVLTAETSSTITAMLVSAVTNGVARPAKIDNYYIAGKTGTSQIARGGGYEKGDGSTITSFAGYAPVHHPKFVILVKFDRPMVGKETWGSTTAAPVFKELAEFLLAYYNIPPDK